MTEERVVGFQSQPAFPRSNADRSLHRHDRPNPSESRFRWDKLASVELKVRGILKERDEDLIRLD